MTDLQNLPNIGPTLAKKLNQSGIDPFVDLSKIGSLEALICIGHTDRSACYNMLYALEGAIRGMRWHLIPKDERALLKSPSWQNHS